MYNVKELETIVQVFENLPMQGTVKTLPDALQLTVSILQKSYARLDELKRATENEKTKMQTRLDELVQEAVSEKSG